MKKYVVTASLLAGFSMISGTAFAQTGTIGAGWSHLDADGAGETDSYDLNGSVASVLRRGGLVSKNQRPPA